MSISIGPGTGADPARTLFAGVVPDGVATVTLHYPAGKLGGFSHRSGPALTATRHVVNNVVVISVERAGVQAIRAVTTTWRSADGATIKTFHGTFCRVDLGSSRRRVTRVPARGRARGRQRFRSRR